ncbi:MAG: efflux RND transporter periplasmic adaptor subunit [bacterium]|nr:efflux RND transporter periplasmic adaptor subunit [bacterium]
MPIFFERLRQASSLTVLLALLALAFAGSTACSRAENSSSDSDATEHSGTDRTGDDESDKKAKKGKKSDDEDEDDEDKEEAVPIEVVDLARGRIETVLRFSTNLEAESAVKVVSQASRQLPVVQLLVEEGADVRKGQVLLRLQNDELRTALERTRGQLAKAEREYDRQTNLHEQQLISEQAYTQATYELEQLQLALKDARRELGYTEVRAPISGTVTERHVSVGNQVAPGQVLFDIVDFDSIVARVYVPEKELWRIRPELEARILAEAARGAERRGSVDRIAPRVDPKSGTIKVTVAIPRSEALLPGMYVSVELVTDVNEDAVLVPKKALIYDADQIFIFRLVKAEEDGEQVDRVERLLVEAQLEDRDNIEAGEALAEGDRIVIAGQAGLKNGSLVRLVGADLESESSEGEPADEIETAEKSE